MSVHDPQPYITLRMTSETSYQRELRQAIEERGGLYNAHLHLDRAGSYEAVISAMDLDFRATISSLSLQEKHSLVSLAHESSHYDPESIKPRLRTLIEAMQTLGTTRLATTVDITDDRVGLTAFEVFLELKREVMLDFDFEIGAYSPSGFRDDAPKRWDLIASAAHRADFLVALPERDDTRRYPKHIGFAQHIERFLDLGREHRKPVHIHIDQANHQGENGAEQVLGILDSKEAGDNSSNELWLIHMISPAAYEEDRFSNLASKLAALDVGVIVCPSAAISMRQVRKATGPMRNSVTRVLELLAAGVKIRLGSDNICDLTSPAGSLDLMDEIFVLSHALRFFDIEILAAMATGDELTEQERLRVVAHLRQNAVEEDAIWKFNIEAK